MADLMSGLAAPLAIAFQMCGRRTSAVDLLLDKRPDPSCVDFQAFLHRFLEGLNFIAAALDFSTKSRAREIPRAWPDGTPMPQPLRSIRHPMGLPGLQSHALEGVNQDNEAAEVRLC
eukprot:2103144-Karenia_brevis.AAC.1